MRNWQLVGTLIRVSLYIRCRTLRVNTVTASERLTVAELKYIFSFQTINNMSETFLSY